MSSIEIGSSATSSRGPVMMARAITARCFCPPDRSDGSLSRNRSTGASPTRSSASDTLARTWSRPLARPWMVSGWPTCSTIVIAGLSAAFGSWNTICRSVRSARSSRSRSRVMSLPPYRIWPPVGCTSPISARPRVVLPLPDSPTSPTTSP